MKRLAFIIPILVGAIGLLAQQQNFPGGTPGGSNGQFQINSNGALGGTTGVTYSASGASTVSITGQASGSNALTLTGPASGAGASLNLVAGAAGRLANIGAACFFDLTGNLAMANTCNINGATNVTTSGVTSGGTLSLTGTGACVSYSATAGGAWAGSGTCSGTTGAATVIITPGTTAPHFWACFGSDLTSHVAGGQSLFSSTTCTLSFATVTNGDNVQITAFAY